jgi:hypothetical protein
MPSTRCRPSSKRPSLRQNFRCIEGVIPEGIYIDASTKTEDGFDVLDLIGDRLVDLCVEEGLGIYVVPLLKAEP